MKAIRLPKVDKKAIEELDKLYRTTGNVRLRERAQMVLLSIEKEMVAAEIAGIVRKDELTVRIWLKRYQAEGITGLEDAPRAVGRLGWGRPSHTLFRNIFALNPTGYATSIHSDFYYTTRSKLSPISTTWTTAGQSCILTLRKQK